MAALIAAGPLPVPPRALDPGIKIVLTEFPQGSFPNVSPDDCGAQRAFRFSCDVYLRSVDYTTYHPSVSDPSSESFEFVGWGLPTLEEIPAPLGPARKRKPPKKPTPKRAKRKTR